MHQLSRQAPDLATCGGGRLPSPERPRSAQYCGARVRTGQNTTTEKLMHVFSGVLYLRLDRRVGLGKLRPLWPVVNP